MKNKKSDVYMIVGSMVVILIINVFFIAQNKQKLDEKAQIPIQEEVKVMNTPPVLKLTFESDLEYIPSCIAIQNQWNGVNFDRSNATTAEIVGAGANKSIMFKDLHVPKVGDTLTIDFGSVKPNSVTIKAQELLEGSLGSALEEKIVSYEEESGVYRFVHPLREETTETIIGRLYTINAKWGDNDCTYAFIINPDGLAE